MDLGIEGKVALVTGASKGLGLGVAEALIAEGATVAISSRSEERIEAAATRVGRAPSSTTPPTRTTRRNSSSASPSTSARSTSS